jgi:glycosyltransferase involved in cell wall biosynthesis
VPSTRLPLMTDGRWKGFHGIGRFACEVLLRLPEQIQLENGPRPLSLADPLWLSHHVITKRPKVFFSPGFNPPLICPVPLVFTIHDLMQVELDCVTSTGKRLYYDLVIKPAARRAYRILTVSEFSRSRILNWTGLPDERVINVGNGVDLPFHQFGERYRPGFPYVLYVGNYRPHKNLDRLFAAFRDVDAPSLRLLLTGTAPPEMMARLEGKGLANRIGFLGAISDERLAAVYRGAKLLVLPSLSEGFGLPALEAMACGVPVVASNNAALPEVLGGAGILVDPLDIADIRSGIEKVLGDSSLRLKMRRLGLQRASRYRWEQVGAAVRNVLQEAAG